MRGYRLFSGSANPEFAKKVGKYLNIEISPAKLTRFSDGEISVKITESVRGMDVFIIQPTCAPTNDNLMELLIMVDALKDQVQNLFLLLFHTTVMLDKIERQLLEFLLLLN